MKFTKMQGIGNDYVYINCFEETVENPSELAVKVSDRHFGIGSDGLILIKPSETCAAYMEMYNADGSQASMCGNGIRCVARYLYEHDMVDSNEFYIDTAAGRKRITINLEHGSNLHSTSSGSKNKYHVVRSITVEMGSPVTYPKNIPVDSDKRILVEEPIFVDGKEYKMTCVSMGNPHAVIFLDDIESLDLEKIGPKFEHHEMFPERTNTEFIKVLGRDEMDMRVWERGSGETLACGTGACAAMYAALLTDRTEAGVTIHLLGGDLFITYDKINNMISMTGPAEIVFEGEF
ncbi:MAG: diaminopimelate epimerase [Lachnospiraceae bacterium]|nr:diaminopimelate epimerase [Lachnospiraceae bacterium]